MSIWTVMEGLRRLHNAHGQLTEIRGYLQTFDRAANFNPRDGDDWDIFDLRNNNLDRIIRILQRVQRNTARLDRATGYAPNHSRSMSNLFGTWAQAYAEHGERGRPTERAQTAYLIQQLQWAEELHTEKSRMETSRREMRRMRAFYEAQEDLFNTLKRLARRVLEFGITSAHQTQALAYYLQFESIANKSRAIARSYGRGLSAISVWQRDITSAERELNAWLSWSRNRRSVSRGLQSGRPPR